MLRIGVLCAKNGGRRPPMLLRMRAVLFIVIMRLEQDTSVLRGERAVMDAGRAYRIGIVAELLAALAVLVVADDQVAREHEHLLPIFVHEGLGRIGARLDAQQAGAVAALARLVERAGEDLFPDPGRI